MTSEQINELLKRAGLDITAYYSGPRTGDTLYPLIEALLTRIEALEHRAAVEYDLPVRDSQQGNFAAVLHDSLKAEYMSYADAIDKLSTSRPITTI